MNKPIQRKLYSSGAPWENIAGYSRGVRIGNQIEIAGTTAVVDGNVIGEGDMYTQAKKCLEIIREAIERLNGTMNDVVRTRMYITDISLWEEATKAHGEFFKDIKPVTTLVEVSALIDPKMLIEIEASAVISSSI